MNVNVRFDEVKRKFIGSIDGKVIVRSQSRERVERKLAEAGVPQVSNKSEPQVYFSVPERFDFINQFVGLVSSGKINSFILVGSGGIGKSHSVTEALKTTGLTEETMDQWGDFLFIKGYSTPKFLYRTLFENNGKIIVFDDCDQAFKDPIAANILKAALDDKDERVITWGSESKDDELPSRFQFTGRVIFISNLSIHNFPQAIISRSAKVNLELTVQEKVERIVEIFKNIDADELHKKDVVSFIHRYADQASDLNIRSSLNLLRIRQNVNDNWERLALYQWVN